jgi:hypothetical protein
MKHGLVRFSTRDRFRNRYDLIEIKIYRTAVNELSIEREQNE